MEDGFQLNRMYELWLVGSRVDDFRTGRNQHRSREREPQRSASLACMPWRKQLLAARCIATHRRLAEPQETCTATHYRQNHSHLAPLGSAGCADRVAGLQRGDEAILNPPPHLGPACKRPTVWECHCGACATLASKGAMRLPRWHLYSALKLPAPTHLHMRPSR